MNIRSKLFWLVWLIVVIAVLWWMAEVASGANYRTIHKHLIQSPKGAEELVPMRVAVLSPSAIVIPPRKPGTNVYYFVATAYSVDLESDFSNEVSFTNVLRSEFAVVAWDPSPSPSAIGYRVHWGRISGQYTNAVDAENNLSLSVRILPPILSNVVITVTSRDATNLQWTTRIGQPWNLLGATNWSDTNPPMRLWRAMGRSPTKPGEVFVSAYRF